MDVETCCSNIGGIDRIVIYLRTLKRPHPKIRGVSIISYFKKKKKNSINMKMTISQDPLVETDPTFLARIVLV